MGAAISSQRPLGWSDPITDALEEIRQQFASEVGGKVADYIPQLSTVDHNLFGLALGSLDGHIYRAGDADVSFTIQSVSKPFVFALALSDLGWEEVSTRVGVEPSGESFNAISLEPGTGRPANPMVNAGAIVTTSLVKGSGPVERFERIRDFLAEFAGHTLEVDEAVLTSERATGNRNRALGYLMHSAGSLRGDVEEAVDVYFRQCSLRVTACDLAVMAATLANGGVNPCTGVAIIDKQIAAQVLTVMATCGMYDYAGEWLLSVGLPAKSGVSGDLIAISPGQFGVGIYSPPLDERGNTVRGVAVSQVLSDRFGLHLMQVATRPAPSIYLCDTGKNVRSMRVRRAAELAVLRISGSSIVIRAVQGDIGFAATEVVLHSLIDSLNVPEGVKWLVLDLSRVTRLHLIAEKMLDAFLTNLVYQGVVVAIADPHMRMSLPLMGTRFSSMHEALEQCEDALLTEHDQSLAPQIEMRLIDHDIISRLDYETKHILAASLTRRTFDAGDELFTDEADLLFLILSGRVAAFSLGLTDDGSRSRFASMGPGTAVTRLALNRSGVSRVVRAELPTIGMMACRTDLERIEHDHPGVVARLWMSFAEWLMWTETRREAA